MAAYAKKRNTSVHIYNEDEVDEMILLIRDSFIPAFTTLKDTLVKKLDEAESNWMCKRLSHLNDRNDISVCKEMENIHPLIFIL